jgi:hypothetical protein
MQAAAAAGAGRRGRTAMTTRGRIGASRNQALTSMNVNGVLHDGELARAL